MVRSRHVVCEECTEVSQTFHQNLENPSRTISRFIKIMYGTDFSEFLYLPLHLGRKVKNLDGKETPIKDSNGKTWLVKLSYVNDKLSFTKGWDKFYQEHGLQDGQFLIIQYMEGSHFVVQIYKKCGCEKTKFDIGKSRSQQSKRSNKRDPKLVSKDESFQTNLNSGAKPTPAINVEDTCMINRNDGCPQGENRNLCDLFDLEAGNETTHANRVSKALDTKIVPNAEIIEKALDTNIIRCCTETTEQATTGLDAEIAVINEISENQINVDFGDVAPAAVDTNQVNDKSENPCEIKAASSLTETVDQNKTMADDAQLIVNRITGYGRDTFSEKFRIEPSEICKFSKGMSNDVPKFQNGSETPSIGSSKIAERENAVKRKFCESSVSSSVLKNPCGIRSIKRERFEIGKDVKIFPTVSCGKEPIMMKKVVKAEPDVSSDDALISFSAEVKTQSYLELPIPIPFPLTMGRKQRVQGKVVYLKTSIKRLWPVIYPEIFSIKAFTANWENFCQQNNIKPGDECRFQAVDKSMCIYRVDVTRRLGVRLS